MFLAAWLILFVYYLFFVRAPPLLEPKAAERLNLKNQLVGSDGSVLKQFSKAYVGGIEIPEFDYSLSADEIRAGDSVWSFKLPSEFVWAGRIVSVDSCHGHPNELVPAKGKDIRDFSIAQRGDPQLPQASFVTDAKNLFYFECGPDERIAKLFYCSENTVFHQNRCTEINDCQSKPDGYVFAAENQLNAAYYECVNGVAEKRKCPPNEYFVTDHCEKPADPCAYLPDETVVEFDPRGYLICKDGASVQIKCLPNEYYHQTLKKCIHNACEGKLRGFLPQYVEDGNFRFAESYIRCDDGVAHLEFCPNQARDPYSPVQTQVFENGRCEPPRMCVNVWPVRDDMRIPNSFYRSRMKNYAYSRVLDFLSGFQCENAKLKFAALPENKKIDSTTYLPKPFCDQKDLRVAYLESETPTFSKYYDCKANRLETCPPSTFFDPQKKSCESKSPHAFKLGHLPVFQMECSSDTNWFQPAPVLQSAVSCAVNETRLPFFNVCADPECEKYGFLAQVPPPRQIYLDATKKCELTPKNKIKATPVSGENSLDFWRQRFTAVPKPCNQGFTLESGDFVLDSVLYVTCDNQTPFLFCPTTNRQTDVKDHVFEPIDLGAPHEANQTYTFRTDEVESFIVDSQISKIEAIVNGKLNNIPKLMKHYIDMQFFKITGPTFEIQFNVDFKVRFVSAPTNSPEFNYVRGRLVRQRFDYVAFRPTLRELEMPRYAFKWTLEGLV